jgi:hypothetical protein
VCSGTNGTCLCADGWTGDACDEFVCLNQCSGHGYCRGADTSKFGISFLQAKGSTPAPIGKCVCSNATDGTARRYFGEDCALLPCMSDCGAGGDSPRGSCDTSTGRCVCTDGFRGPPNGYHCDSRVCSLDCGVAGTCLDDACICPAGDAVTGLGGFRGANCEVAICPRNCSRAQGHGDCIEQRCQCSPRYWGEACERRACPRSYLGKPLVWTGAGSKARGIGPMCDDHGTCLESGVCACDAGWTGAACDVRTCMNHCSGHGICHPTTGYCQCDAGFHGLDCSQSEDSGAIVTESSSSSSSANVSSSNESSSNSSSSSSSRVIPDGPCPSNCSGIARGLCLEGQCLCRGQFHGRDCSLTYCQKHCSERGKCDPFTGTCRCYDGYGGPACNLIGYCSPVDCNGHGKCEHRRVNASFSQFRCNCAAGFLGSSCQYVGCANNCHGRGKCRDFKCFCDKGFAGAECEIEICPKQCSGSRHGDCVLDDAAFGSSSSSDVVGRQGCRCHHGFGGKDCAIEYCKHNCTGRGECVAPSALSFDEYVVHHPELFGCACEPGRAGSECQKPVCNPDPQCGGAERGECHVNAQNDTATCACKHPYTGVACRDIVCSHPCGAHGSCLNFKCVCAAGWRGEECEEEICPNACNAATGQGTCTEDGTTGCVCNDGFYGPQCAKHHCPNTCGAPLQRGRCLSANGTCLCAAGWSGTDCATATCVPANCNNHGVCQTSADGSTAACECVAPHRGDDCSQSTLSSSSCLSCVVVYSDDRSWTPLMCCRLYQVCSALITTPETYFNF